MFDAIISSFVEITTVIGNFLWGPWTQIILIGTGLYFTVGTRFYQFRKFGYIMKNTLGSMFKKSEASTNRLTSVQAVMSALSGTIGMGNIAGISITGPAYRIDEEYIERYLPKLKEAASQISRALGK